MQLLLRESRVDHPNPPTHWGETVGLIPSQDITLNPPLPSFYLFDLHETCYTSQRQVQVIEFLVQKMGEGKASEPYVDLTTRAASSWLYVSLFTNVGLLVALTTFTPFQLAANVGEDTTGIGSTLAAYGIGLFAGLVSLHIKFWSVDTLMVIILIATTIAQVALPFNKSLGMLYVYQFIGGMCLSNVETGAMYMVRKINGKKAGVWLGLTGSFMAMGFFTIPMVMLITDDNIYAEYLLVAACLLVSTALLLYKIKQDRDVVASAAGGGAVLVATTDADEEEASENDDQDHVDTAASEGIEMMKAKAKAKAKVEEAIAKGKGNDSDSDADTVDLNVPHGEQSGHAELSLKSLTDGSDDDNDNKLNEEDKVQDREPRHFYVEYVSLFILFLFVGMENSIGVYLQQYLVESVHLEIADKNSYQTVFTIASSASKFLIPLYQYHYPKPKQIRFLLNLSNILNVIFIVVWYAASDAGNIDANVENGPSGMVHSLATNKAMFYMFLTMNGLVTGGTMSLIYDTVNVLTDANMTSTMILTSGIYIGSSVYPWLVSVVWEACSETTGHMVYPTGTLIASVVIMFVSPLMQYVSYVPNGGDRAEAQDAEGVRDGEDVEDVKLVFNDDGSTTTA